MTSKGEASTMLLAVLKDLEPYAAKIDRLLAAFRAAEVEVIEAKFQALKVSERTPAVLRNLGVELLKRLARLQIACAAGSPIPVPTLLFLLCDALLAANKGERHPLLCLPQDDLTRSRAHPLVPMIQGRAAAVLERAFTDFGERQDEWAATIAKRLGTAGFLTPGKLQPYTGDAVRKWRARCIRSRHHPSTPHFEEALRHMRHASYRPDTYLDTVVWLFERELTCMNGN